MLTRTSLTFVCVCGGALREEEEEEGLWEGPKEGLWEAESPAVGLRRERVPGRVEARRTVVDVDIGWEMWEVGGGR